MRRCVYLLTVSAAALLSAASPVGAQHVEPETSIDASDREVVERFSVIFARPDARTVFANRWLGIPTQQNPNDVWITQEILFETKPEVIVETGSFRGGSAALYAMLLEQVSPGGRVISIDITDLTAKAQKLPIVQRSVDFLIGSSVAEEVVADVKRRTAGKKVMVILDSAHTKDHVLAELRAYASLVPVGGYVIVQDTTANGHPIWPDYGPGPYEAVEAFLAENDTFEVDESRERLLHTLHPHGYLKRVK
jgi:cephalosporin hydroxylase